MNFRYNINGGDRSRKSYYRKTKKRTFDNYLLIRQTTRNTRIENDMLIMQSGQGNQANRTLVMTDPDQCTSIMN